MKKQQQKLDAFKKVSLPKQQRKAVKGGYKYGPSNVGFYGSNIWENIDIRDQSLDSQLGGKFPFRNKFNR